jgi:hypothetical protein
MDKDEALKLALEALDNLLYWDNGKSDYDQAREAITAIQQARSAPVQEPIGYLFQHEETGLTMVVDVQQVEWGFEKNNPRHQKIGPVYTTPPAAQRQWVGLSQDDLDAMFSNTIKGKKLVNWVARAIEAKLKEKNT